MKQIKSWAGVVALLIAIIGLFLPLGRNFVGAVGTRFPNGVGIGSATMSVVTGFFQASSSALFTGPVSIGSRGTAVNQLFTGWCDFGPITAGQTIAATTTGVVACTTQIPGGLAADDKVFLTASSTSAAGPNNVGNALIYTGVASSSAATRIQALLYNGMGGAYTVATTSWQYFIVR